MISREILHRLIDELPDNTLPAVQEYLEAVSAGCPPDDPYDDVPLNEEELAMLAESEAEIARGELLSHDEVMARLAAHRESA